MARVRLEYRHKDHRGNTVVNTKATLYEPETTTQIDAYAASSGGSALTQPIAADDQGYIVAWLDEAQDVELVVTDDTDWRLHEADDRPFVPAGDLEESLASLSATYARTKRRGIRGPGVMLRFDDGYTGQYTVAKPIMDLYGFKAVTYITTGWLGTTQVADTVMTGAQLVELHAAGWEIAAHTRTHPSLAGASAATLATELDGCIADIVALGLPRPVSFVYPSGSRDAASDKAVYRRFAKCGLTNNPEYGPIRYDAPVFFNTWMTIDGVSNTAAWLARAKRYVATSIAQGRIPILGFHGFTAGVSSSAIVLAASVFEELCAWLYAEGYETILPRDTMPHQLLIDPGFEEFPLETPAGYNNTAWLPSSLTYWSRSATGAKTGTYCAKIDTGGNVDANSNVSQWIDVEPGKVYRLRASIHMPTRVAGGVRINVAHQDYLNAQPAVDFDKVSVVAANAGYVDYSTTFTAASKSAVAKIVIAANSFNGVAFVDDVFVYRDDQIDPMA